MLSQRWVAVLFGLVIFLQFLSHVRAIPKFNQVNHFDVSGQLCPFPTYYDYPCPTVCVRQPDLCPSMLRPACRTGEVYCVDGSCRASCPPNLTSSCACPHSTLQGSVYPCAPFRVTIPDFTVANKTDQSLAACTSAFGNPAVLDWSPNPQPDTLMWNTCPSSGSISLTGTEPLMVAIYVVYGGSLIILGLWIVYKHLREKSVLSGISPSKMSPTVVIDKEPLSKEKTSATTIMNQENDSMVIKMYQRHWIGTLVACMTGVFTLGHVAFMIVMTIDYYQGHQLVHGNETAHSSIFLALWYMYLVWFAFLAGFRHRLFNFFRLRCSYSQVEYMQVEQAQTPIVFQQNASSSTLTHIFRSFDQKVQCLVGSDKIVTTVPVATTTTGLCYFVYQCTRFVYDNATGTFKPHTIDLGRTHADLCQLQGGLTTKAALQREAWVGPNFIHVHVPGLIASLVREFSTFFYIYQFTILWLFFYYAYWQVGVADMVVILLSATIKMFVRRRSELRVKAMAEFTDHVQVIRDGEWQSLSTAELLPGDVIQIQEGKTMPCDGILLQGQLVMDESSLTGEPMPVRKTALHPNNDTYDRTGISKSSSLFAGTTLSQAQEQIPGMPVLVLVTHTGTATDKGKLVKNILFPSPVSFIFDEHIKVVIVILFLCGLACFGFALWLYTTGITAWFYSLFSISQLVSPLLPAALVVGQSVAAGRLRSQHIFCIDLPRILMAGKVQIFCFDKTGTLTQDGLTFFGALPVDPSHSSQFDELAVQTAQLPRMMQLGLGACHTVTTIDGTSLIGHPVDVEMFQASGWKLGCGSGDELIAPDSCSLTRVEVLKRFEFVHARMSMSVVVLDRDKDEIHVLVKGAYEKILSMCRPETVPSDYMGRCNDFARQGCYVLTFAYRTIRVSDLQGGIEEIQSSWSREKAEQDLVLGGLIVFKNEIKPDTADAISTLKQGATRTVMITGDTALTGVYVARQCGMHPPNVTVLLGDYSGKLDCVVWKDVDDPSRTFSETGLDALLASAVDSSVELAVTGPAFDWLVQSERIRQYLLSIRVFARMTPQGKVTCVKLFMEHGITAMTGDGGNDCGALRAAHVGLAMSEAEASIVSPFSTSNKSVNSCVELLRQGRAALATSLTNYKYLVLYGQVLLMLKIFTYYFSVSLSQAIWIVIDVFITVLLTWAISQAKAAKSFAPYRPTAKLFGYQTLASTLGLITIHWLTASGAFVMLYRQAWFRCHEFDSSSIDLSHWWQLADNYEGEVLALVCLYQLVNNAAVFNFGHHFRLPFIRNYSLVCLWLVYLGVVSYWTLADPNSFGCLFRFNCGTADVLESLHYTPPRLAAESYNTPLGHNVMPRDFRWKLWGLCMANIVAGLTWERLIVLGPGRDWLARRFPPRRLQLTP